MSGAAHRRRARIANRSAGGLWWRAPAALLSWLPFAAPVIAAVVVAATLRQYAAGLPQVPDLDAWEAALPRTSVIVTADGAIAAELPFRVGDEVGHRFPVATGELSPLLVEALLAAEDVRFYAHQGVDARAVVRAAWANYRAGGVVEGASTITQQVARGLLPVEIGRERSLRRKVREALLARRIERRYDKDRILSTYANHVFLGANAYGVAAAARAYFSKHPDELSLDEAAMIAGLAQAPGRADPYRDEGAARARRDEVLGRMHRAGFIDAAALEQARARPIALVPPPRRYGQLAPWHTERARREVEQAAPEAYDLGGLRIETSAGAALSLVAAERAGAWSERLGARREHGPPQLGALVWDHRTGYVEATVGGLSWADSRFDRATQACRQPGSTFKPIVYAAAIIDDAITPGTPLRDAPIAEYDEERGVHWKPGNTGRAFRGVALATDALAASLNAPAVDVLDRVGAGRVVELAGRLGMTTDVAEVRPMALGASCVIPLELAGAFAAFARGGTTVEPRFVVRVRRGDEVLWDRASPHDPSLAPARRLDRMAAAAGAEAPRALDAQSAFLVSDMLVAVVERGTATAARQLGRPAAGKTGTTNDNTDAWFVGYTGRVVGAVWLGHDDPARSLGPRQDGSRAALPLWIELVAAAEGARAAVALPGAAPERVRRARVDRETGLLAAPGAGGAVDIYFKEGSAPTETVGRGASDLGRLTREF